jgi:hypothetical protein
VGLVEGLGVVDGVLAGRVGHLGPDQVDARVGVEPAAFEVFLPVAVGRAVGVGPGDDDGVVVLLGVDGRLEAGDGVLAGDDLLAGDVATPLGRGLVLDVDGGDPGLLVLPDRAADVVDAAVAGVTVGDDRQVRRLDLPFRVLDHLAHVDHLQVREAKLAQDRRVARHVDGVVAGHLRQAGVQRVVGARREDVVLVVQLLAQFTGGVVVDVPDVGVCALNSARNFVGSVVVVCHVWKVDRVRDAGRFALDSERTGVEKCYEL